MSDPQGLYLLQRVQRVAPVDVCNDHVGPFRDVIQQLYGIKRNRTAGNQDAGIRTHVLHGFILNGLMGNQHQIRCQRSFYRNVLKAVVLNV